MTKEHIKNLILTKLNPDEELIGFFQANYLPSLFWVLLIGPCLFLGLRPYYIGVTQQGLHFYRFNLFGDQEHYNFFSYTEVTKIKLRKGLLQTPLKIWFSNGRKLKVRLLKESAKVAKLDTQTEEFLLSKYS